METYERIRDLRKKELKLTQEVFSASINISRSNLGNIETGRITVTDRIISDICKTYNVSEKWLRTGEGEIFVPKNTEQKIIDIFTRILHEDEDSFPRQLITTLAELTPEQWKSVEAFARSVVYKTDSAKKEKEEE